VPKLCIDSALLGANLFINKVFPSLFPFLVITGLMMSYNGVDVYSRLLGKLLCKPLRLPQECAFVLVVSILCGYPLGAKYACDLYEKKIIDYKTCQRLISIATNASPLFVIGSVGTSMLKNPLMGYMLILSNYISCFIMVFLIPSKIEYIKQSKINNTVSSNKNIGIVIKESIESSIITCLSIGGFVILFCVITNIIKSNIMFDIAVKKIHYITEIQSNLIEGSLLGLIEMTNGCYIISTTATSMYVKIIIISFFLGFSGLSIISQVHSFTYKHDLSMKKYILRKIIQGFVCAVITIVLYKFIFPNVSVQTFNYNHNYTGNVLFTTSIILMLVPLINKIKKLFHAS
jgi:sporulation integral membrane protein YlbJ